MWLELDRFLTSGCPLIVFKHSAHIWTSDLGILDFGDW